ncbi:MAG: TetR/AcrR family transcriptional regulator [Eubacterium sp.]|nr:TetR/AcrR family transcriptional regulator [Eubacterium sp.]
MPRGSEEQTQNRKEEIIDACDKLYQTLNYNEITLKEISKETTFSRPSIYNYFETKEEIFLGLLNREYRAWASDLRKVGDQDLSGSVDAFADAIAETVEKRLTLLKIQSMNLFEIEEHSRMERLVEYKKAFLSAMDAFLKALKKNFPEMTEEERSQFRYAFFPFMYGIYPYVYPSEKQCRAMDAVGIPYQKTTVREMTRQFICGFLK